MNRALLDRLACPGCGQKALRLEGTSDAGQELMTGHLSCPGCKAAYAIQEGLPIMLPDEDAKRFGVWDALHRAADFNHAIRAAQTRARLPRRVQEDYFSQATLAKRMPPVRSLVDIGCGSGTYALALQTLANIQDLTLVDISAAALQGSRKMMEAFGIHAHYVVADIRQLPFAADAFDLATSGGLIEHFAGAEQQRILQEHCRVAPRVLIQAPEPTLAYWTFRGLYSVYKGGWPFGYEKPISRQCLRRLLREQHFLPKAWGGHDFASALAMMGAARWPGFPRLHTWPGFAWLSRHDSLVWAEREAAVASNTAHPEKARP